MKGRLPTTRHFSSYATSWTTVANAPRVNVSSRTVRSSGICGWLNGTVTWPGNSWWKRRRSSTWITWAPSRGWRPRWTRLRPMAQVAWTQRRLSSLSSAAPRRVPQTPAPADRSPKYKCSDLRSGWLKCAACASRTDRKQRAKEPKTDVIPKVSLLIRAVFQTVKSGSLICKQGKEIRQLSALFQLNSTTISWSTGRTSLCPRTKNCVECRSSSLQTTSTSSASTCELGRSARTRERKDASSRTVRRKETCGVGWVKTEVRFDWKSSVSVVFAAPVENNFALSLSPGVLENCMISQNALCLESVFLVC